MLVIARGFVLAGRPLPRRELPYGYALCKTDPFGFPVVMNLGVFMNFRLGRSLP